jgi:hypothetical protein
MNVEQQIRSWRVNVEKVEVQHYGVYLKDKSRPPAAAATSGPGTST